MTPGSSLTCILQSFSAYLAWHVMELRLQLSKNSGHRIEGCVLEERGGHPLNPVVRSTGNLLMETLHQTRLADSSFAADQNDLPFTPKGAFPPMHQQTQLVVPANERGQAASRRCDLDTPLHIVRPNYAIQLNWLPDAFECLFAAIFDNEHS